MRVLFSCIGSVGHFYPLVPLARAVARAGHDVAVATAESFGAEVAAAGLDHLPAGMSQEARMNAFAPFREALAALPIEERRTVQFIGNFARLAPPVTYPQLLAAAKSWQPDVIVHEAAEMTAPIVAAVLGVPSVSHGFGRMLPLPQLAQATEVIAPLWADAGFDVPPYAGYFRYLYVDPCPPSFQDQIPPPDARVALVRPLAYDGAQDQAVPQWLDRLPHRQTVYVTLGTVFNDIKSFRVMIDALAALDVNAIVTVGGGVDPSQLGVQPANVRVEQYIPQSAVLPRAAVAVTHGGSGSTLGALGHGVPMVFVPRSADQFENAAAATKLGCGLTVMPKDFTAEAVRDAVARVLGESRFAAAAARLQAEIRAMPMPASAVVEIEALVQPLG